MTMLDYESDAMVTEEVWEPQRPQPLSDATPPNPSATTASSHPRLKSSSSRPSLLLLSNSTTDPSLFSFDTIKRLNQQHLASIPPNPLSAISIAQQHQHHLNQEQVRRYPLHPSSACTIANQSRNRRLLCLVRLHLLFYHQIRIL